MKNLIFSFGKYCTLKVDGVKVARVDAHTKDYKAYALAFYLENHYQEALKQTYKSELLDFEKRGINIQYRDKNQTGLIFKRENGSNKIEIDASIGFEIIKEIYRKLTGERIIFKKTTKTTDEYNTIEF